MIDKDKERLTRLEALDIAMTARVERIEQTLGTLISWLGSVQGSPIGRREATELLKVLKGEKA